MASRALRRFGFHRYSNGRLLLVATMMIIVSAYGFMIVSSIAERFASPAPTLLTDPFLQLPTPTSVRVVWFTEFAGDRHHVEYGENFAQVADATTTQLSRTREDQLSWIGTQKSDGSLYAKPTPRSIWRHEAEITGLTGAARVPYRVMSRREDDRTVTSQPFTLAGLPEPNTPLKILLTSDHQMMPMTPANLQKVAETVGRVDAVFLAGDLINVSDRASEWFDDSRGGAFFPSLQGRASYELEREGVKTRYVGGELIQHAPLFPATGNHEVMGRFSTEADLNAQFSDPYPRRAAAALYQRVANQVNPNNDEAVRQAWLKNNSFNTDTYDEIFTLPSGPGGESYYAVTFGDIRLVVLYATNIWRTPKIQPSVAGRYQERTDDFDQPEKWGFGQHIFEPIAKGSRQYEWLQAELSSAAFQQAKYKIVMFHHPPHSLGDNVVPPYTDPVQIVQRNPRGQVKFVGYEYPIEQDYLIRDVVPLLEAAGVQLVFYGHSHLWNRFTSSGGIHFLESSNVGNTYGAYLGDQRRSVPPNNPNYVAVGDPNGLSPIAPSIAPLSNDANQPQPFIASNDITVFSIFDTATGTVSSYRFDCRSPQAGVEQFDRFQLKG